MIDAPDTAAVHVAGERLVLLPERAVYHAERGTLLLADPHWGKAAAFRAGGIPVPRGTTTAGVERLEGALRRTGARRLVVLGDFLHAREGRAPETLRALLGWRERHPSLELVVVRGNHDRGAGDPPPELRARCVDEPVMEAPFALAHHPGTVEGAYTLSGHLHPGVRLVGRGRRRERLPCFWFGHRGAVLPAFGDFTGLADVAPARTDHVFVIAGGSVLEVSGG